MTREEFWQWIGVLGGSCEPHAVEALVERLAEQGEAVVIEFADQLAAALYAIDTPDRFAQDVRDVSDAAHAALPPMSSDVFLYARAAVVAAGRDAYERVLADPAAMSGVWQVADGELLLSAAPNAYERATGLAWDHETPASPETGSNTAAWHGGGDLVQRPPAEQPWFSLTSGTDLGVRPSPVYQEALFKLVQAISLDPEWIAWWQAAPAAQLWLAVTFLDGKPPAWRLSRGRKAVQVFINENGRGLLDGDWQEKHARAVADLDEWLTFVADSLELAHRPNLPPLAGPFSH